MYEELVKTMRHCVATMDCLTCPVESIDKSAKAQKRCLTLVLAQAADAIEELSKTKWISVEDRLPEPYVEVLLYSGGDRYTGYMHNDKRFTVNASHYPDRPTHWMPLPEPPKEETNVH